MGKASGCSSPSAFAILCMGGSLRGRERVPGQPIAQRAWARRPSPPSTGLRAGSTGSIMTAARRRWSSSVRHQADRRPRQRRSCRSMCGDLRARLAGCSSSSATPLTSLPLSARSSSQRVHARGRPTAASSACSSWASSARPSRTRPGVGSAAIAHSAAETPEPAREGIVALLEPFIDTVVVCTMTALVIVITGRLQLTPSSLALP